jgi:hypothetical protein
MGGTERNFPIKKRPTALLRDRGSEISMSIDIFTKNPPFSAAC